MNAMTFPPLKAGESPAIWNGSAFSIGDTTSRVLAYEVGESGWSDELTALHEDATEGGTHFIDMASRKQATDELKRVCGGRPTSILEVGCSGGHLLVDMQRELPQASLVGGDYTIGTLNVLGKKISGIPLIRFDLTKCPLPSESFDAVVLLNVLEHIEDDAAGLFHIARILKPGGSVVIEVPSGPELFDDYDRQLQHFRRYTLDGMCSVVENAGLEIEKRNYLGALIYPAFRIAKMRSRTRPKPATETKAHVENAIRSTSRFNFIGHAIMRTEALLHKAIEFPKGIRCIVTARKPK